MQTPLNPQDLYAVFGRRTEAGPLLQYSYFMLYCPLKDNVAMLSSRIGGFDSVYDEISHIYSGTGTAFVLPGNARVGEELLHTGFRLNGGGAVELIVPQLARTRSYIS